MLHGQVISMAITYDWFRGREMLNGKQDVVFITPALI